MKKRSVAGLVIGILGFIMIIASLIIGSFAIFSLGVYGVIFLILGLIVYLNKKEDKIEEINYSKMKGGSKK